MSASGPEADTLLCRYSQVGRGVLFPRVLIFLTEKKHIHNTSTHHVGAKIDIFVQDVRRSFADREFVE
jgi:hypothetical protein